MPLEPDQFFLWNKADFLERLMADKGFNDSLLFFDDFSQGTTLPWVITTGTGTIARDTTVGEWSSGGASMKVLTSTVAAESMELHRFLPKRPNTSQWVYFGGRIAFQDGNGGSTTFFLGFHDGAKWYRAKLFYTYADNTWKFDAGGSGGASNITLITRNPAAASSQARWHDFLLVADFAALKHLTIQLDEQDFASAVSGVALRNSADATLPNMLDFAIETDNLGGTPSAAGMLVDRLFAFVQ